MSEHAQWLFDLEASLSGPAIDGLVRLDGYSNVGRPPDEVAIMEKARIYGAHSVFFEAGRIGRSPAAQAFIFISNGPADDAGFGELHRRLWSWGGVPLIYRKTPGLVQLFRCAHKPDFVSASGQIVCRPIRTLKLAAAVASDDAWWNATCLRNGTLWDDPAVCKVMLSASKGAHKRLINAVKQLNRELNHEGILKKHLRRRLLILSLLIAYLEERGVFAPGYFSRFVPGATQFFEVLEDGKALVALVQDLEERFNGNVFAFDKEDRELLSTSNQLRRFAKLVEAHEEPDGQLTLWQIYSFKDLPVELISHIYQLFVTENDSAVYTPPFLVRLMLEEALSWDRLDRLEHRGEIILDPACGSGVFLVEAYKRLVLHWRSRNEWRRPRIPDVKRLLKKVHGIDLEPGAIELAAFSLCLALCDALEPEAIRASIKLFPILAGKTLHQSCFFEAKEQSLLREPVGVVVGNPPFESALTTPGAQRSYERYQARHGLLPDKQLGYLFLHDAMELIAEGGVLSMLQQYNFLYNQQSCEFRRRFMATWDVREILDFISVRGLFHKGGADTKVIVVVADAASPEVNRKILHAVFRRSGRVDAEQGFDIDYYDLHWLQRELVLKNDAVWRADLLGGGRVLAFVDRLKKFRTLRQYADEQGWDFGEGFIEGQAGDLRSAEHLTGKKLLPSTALSDTGIDRDQITTVTATRFKSAYTSARFTPPILLMREQMDLPHAIWSKGYLTYKDQIVGLAAPKAQGYLLSEVENWLTKEMAALRAYVASTSTKLFTKKATTLAAADILALPYPESGSLDLSDNETLLAEDIVKYQRDLVRLGEDAAAMEEANNASVNAFSEVFAVQISSIYKTKPLRALPIQTWPGVICQPFVFGNGNVDWRGADALQGKLDALFRQKHETTLVVTRIARVYDDKFVFLLKPNRLRYWLRSVALRDADEVLADLRLQGY